ncbi:MAG: tRNA uridine-5-carboxymethylaminomethyl(34) synthesis enzyme MnmG [Planctomycetota bacterium]
MAFPRTHYDILVVGGGHAGAEAAWAAANLTAASGGRVALVTMDPAKTGAMSCNPAIGGLAKGQIVREIDALGGLMGLAADATGIQFRVLNASKGPAVRGPRCQNDKYAYAAEVQRLLGARPNLEVLPGVVEDFVVEDGRCVGVEFRGGHGPGHPEETQDCCGEFCAIDHADKTLTIRAGAVVLTTGTFMRALMHAGPQQTPGGRIGEGSADGISGALKRLGFELGRLKTGTPPRLAAESIDFAGLEEQPGDADPVPFSEMTLTDRHGSLPDYEKVASRFPVLDQAICWITHTTAAAHDLIRANLAHAPMYNGSIEADAGPRYCPSIEDKVVRFADRTSHHVFLEPESLTTNEVYCNGISTSLPPEVQLEIVRAMPGCERAEMLKPGYAVEYDMVWPHQIDATCMTKRLPGLFLAGQINGTSGYEEAAGQGLIAGVNAVRHLRGESPWRLRRDEAYLGVMMDDLVTKTPREPYRMFTSRAEHRLLLRSDNADTRLTPVGRELGTVDNARWSVFEAKRRRKADFDAAIESTTVDGRPMAKWVNTPGVDLDRVQAELNGHASDRRALQAVLAERQYAGYIERSRRELERLAEREDALLPSDLDFRGVPGLRAEAAAVLDKFRPATLGQAGRLAGVNPADLMVVSVAVGRP